MACRGGLMQLVLNHSYPNFVGNDPIRAELPYTTIQQSALLNPRGYKEALLDPIVKYNYALPIIYDEKVQLDDWNKPCCLDTEDYKDLILEAMTSSKNVWKDEPIVDPKSIPLYEKEKEGHNYNRYMTKWLNDRIHDDNHYSIHMIN